MISTIHDATIVNTGRKNRKTNEIRSLMLLASTINS
jgi:hypothetical protein